MPIVFNLLATEVPIPQRPVAGLGLRPTSITPPVSRDLQFGSERSDLIPKWQANFVAADLSGGSAGGVFGIVFGLEMSDGGGLLLALAEGWAWIDGMRHRSATSRALIDNSRNFVWMNQAGAITPTTTTDPPSDGPYAFLGSALCAGGAITEIDGSGVMWVGGIPWRQTADASAPGDTPPADVRFLSQSGDGVYLWTGTAWASMAGGGGGGGTGPSPSNTVHALDGTGDAGAAVTYSRGDHRHQDVNRPTTGEKQALVGTVPPPSSSNKYVTEADTRLSNNRTPTNHGSTHLPLGSDPIPTAAATDLADANSAGTANSLVRSDHKHKRTTRVKASGVDVGTRNAINITGAGATVTDNPGTDSVDIDITSGGGGGPSPSGTVAALDGTGVAGSSATYSRGDHRHQDVNRPTDGQKAALAGTDGTPGDTNRYVTDSDARNTNNRTPTAHASTHLPAGSDPLAHAAPVALGSGIAMGTAESFALSDHVHPRALRVTEDGSLVGIRGTLEVTGSGVAAVDDPDNDRIILDVTGGGGGGGGTPSGVVAALDGTSAAGTSDLYSRGDHKHPDVNRPTDGQKQALAGTVGTPSSSNPYVTNQDARNSNARTPTPHAATHLVGGSDALPVGVPVALGSALDVGTGTALALATHVHPRASEVALNGATIATRRRTNFTGQGIAVTDDSANNQTTVALNAAGHIIENAGTPLPQRAKLNFTGAVMADDPGNNATNVSVAQASQFWSRSTGGVLYPQTIGDHVGVGGQGSANNWLRVTRAGPQGWQGAGSTGIWVDSTIGPGDVSDGNAPDIGAVTSIVNYTCTDPGANQLASTGVDSRFLFGDPSHAAKGTLHCFTATGDIANSSGPLNEAALFMGWLRCRGNPGTKASLWGMDMSIHGPIGAQPGTLLGPVFLVNNYFNGSPSRCPSAGINVVTAPGMGAGGEDGHNAATTYPLDYGISVAGQATGGANGFNVGLQIGGEPACPWITPDNRSRIGTGIRLQDLTHRAITLVGGFTEIQWGDDGDPNAVQLTWPGNRTLGVNGRYRVMPYASDLVNDALIDAGSPTNNQANSIRVWSMQGGQGRGLSMFVAGASGQFLAGTPVAAGDVGLRVEGAARFHLGRGGQNPDVTLATDGTLTANRALSVGTATNAARVTGMLGASASYAPPTMNNGQQDVQTFAVAGATPGDCVQVGFDQALPQGMFWSQPQVSAPGFVTANLINWSGVAQSVAAGTVRLLVTHLA